MRKAFKYRLWTNANQERELGIMLETHRRLYNACLDQRKTVYETEKKSVKYTEQSAWFKAERTTNPYFARLNFSSAQATMRRLDKAYQNFFRRVKAGEKPGYPRFKARGRFESIEFPAYGDGIRLNGDRLRVQHVGVIRVKLHRPHEGVIKTATLKLEDNKWFLILSCDLGNVTVPKSSNPPVGIDVGIESFLVTSEGDHEPNPRFLKNELPALRRAGRAVSRKKKGGSNRCKAVKRLRRHHARVRNLRHEHHHKTALKLVRRYGLVAVEDLNVRGMVKNHCLARAISDAGWSSFRSILKSKAESAGVQVVEVDPAYTSQVCSSCGQLVQKALSERWHTCDCGCSLHRDVNAARNILARGQVRTEPVGANVGHKIKRFPRSRRLQATE
jgi:putative transposase